MKVEGAHQKLEPANALRRQRRLDEVEIEETETLHLQVEQMK